MEKGTKILVTIGGVLAVGVGGFLLYNRFFKKSKATKIVDYASKIKASKESEAKKPTPFNPQPIAYKLYKSMKGWMTDESMLFNALKSIPKINGNENYLVMGYFNQHYGEGSSLDEWFDGDLSGSELSRAKGYFR